MKADDLALYVIVRESVDDATRTLHDVNVDTDLEEIRALAAAWQSHREEHKYCVARLVYVADNERPADPELYVIVERRVEPRRTTDRLYSIHPYDNLTKALEFAAEKQSHVQAYGRPEDTYRVARLEYVQ